MDNENSNTYLIMGLGNPGNKYDDTRHNVGFMVLNEIAKQLNVNFSRVKSQAIVTQGQLGHKRIMLAKPQTYMNLSGQAVAALSRFHKIPLGQILIVYDDADLEFERIRMRPEGGSAGQKGVKSIIQHLGTQEFPRLRVGIGRPPGRMRTPDYVLQKFSKQQSEFLPFVIDRAAKAALFFVENGMEDAMNEFNQKPVK
ncbi:MAG: aminoacyl-tRNA hydrolase [Chloroflexota bacterium]